MAALRTNLTSLLLVLFILAVSVGQVSALNFSKIYFSDQSDGTLNRCNLDGTNLQTLLTGFGGIEGLALNAECGQLYWSDFSTELIQKSNLDGSVIVDIAEGSLSSRVALAIDPVAEKIYWSDSDNGVIQQANLDGSGQVDIVPGLNRPWGIALDLANGHIYWADRSAKKIQRADLNGANQIDIIPSGLAGPFGIGLDLVAGKIYFSDVTIAITPVGSIKCSNLNGSNLQTVATGLGTVMGIAVDPINGSIFWTDSDNGKIQRSNLDGSAVSDVLTGLSDPRGIAVDAPPICALRPLLDVNGDCRADLFDFALASADWLACGLFPFGACDGIQPRKSGVIIGNILTDVFNPYGISEGLAGEPNIPVELLQGGQVIASTLTDSNGDYNFSALTEGAYQVRAEMPDLRSATGDVEVAANLSSELDFLIVESKTEGIFPSWHGLAVDINTMADPDLNSDLRIGLDDLNIVRSQGALADPAVVELIENYFGRSVAYLPGNYEAQVTDGGTVFEVGGNLATGKSLSGYTLAKIELTEVHNVIRLEVIEDRGTATLSGLGTFSFTENPNMLTYMFIDLNTNLCSGDLHLIFDGDDFPQPIECDVVIPTGYIVGAPNGFSLYHFVGLTGTLDAQFPVYGGMVFSMAKCDPPKADVACVVETVDVNDARCDYGGQACKTEGAACASSGRCGTCTTKKKNLVGGHQECRDCECF
jgi:uncharacterized protein YjbI with pentapeptide repeats